MDIFFLTVFNIIKFHIFSYPLKIENQILTKIFFKTSLIHSSTYSTRTPSSTSQKSHKPLSSMPKPRQHNYNNQNNNNKKHPNAQAYGHPPQSMEPNLALPRAPPNILPASAAPTPEFLEHFPLAHKIQATHPHTQGQG